MSNDDQQTPATADGAGRLSDEWIGRHPKMFTTADGREFEHSDDCQCCDQRWSWSGLNEQRICINCWEHTATLRADVARLAVLETSAGRRCAEAEAALATAERERDAYRAQVSEELAARESEQAATTRLAASHHEWVDRATRAESRARALREALDRYVATDGGCGCLECADGSDGRICCSACLYCRGGAALAAANDAPATQPAAPTCKWCWTAVPSWGDVCASCEANMLAAHSDLADSDGPGSAPSGEA